MKFHFALADGRWIGGMQCQRADLAGELEKVREAANLWGQPVVVTRVDKVGRRRGERYVVANE
jgi:hypothetical protein